MAYARPIGIAAGAGLTSALLFAASAKGSALALVIAYVTPLPVMIATLGFAQATGLLAAGIACAVIAVLLGVLVAGVFGVLIAFPAWWLAYLSQLARPAEVIAPAGATTPAMVWFPVGRVVAWAAALVTGVVLAFGAATVLHYGSFDATLAALTLRLKGLLSASSSATEQAFADSAGAAVRLLPAVLAGSTFLMLVANLWLAGRIVQGSGLLARPWPPLPENLRLPRSSAVLLFGAAAAAFAGGLAGVVAGVVAAPLGIAFVLQGLGSAHALTRGLLARRLILFFIYFVSLSIAPSLLALAVLGVVDCLLPLRRKRPPTPSPTPTR